MVWSKVFGVRWLHGVGCASLLLGLLGLRMQVLTQTPHYFYFANIVLDTLLLFFLFCQPNEVYRVPLR